MDKTLQLLKRQVQTNPGDVETLQLYIRALERAQGGEETASEPIKFFLLSNYGARHEDRLPIAIFSTLQAARDYIQNYANAYYEGGEIGFQLDSFEVDPSNLPSWMKKKD